MKNGGPERTTACRSCSEERRPKSSRNKSQKIGFEPGKKSNFKSERYYPCIQLVQRDNRQVFLDFWTKATKVRIHWHSSTHLVDIRKFRVPIYQDKLQQNSAIIKNRQAKNQMLTPIDAYTHLELLIGLLKAYINNLFIEG